MGAVLRDSCEGWDSGELARFGLRDAAALDEPVDLQRELGLEQFLFGAGQPRSAKDVGGDSPTPFPCHDSVTL